MEIEKKFLHSYPKLKLSYETLLHKKVFNADVILAIPQGKKCYVWFTTEDTHYVCYLLELGSGGIVDRTHKLPCSFSKELSYGSVYYGTMYLYNHRQFVIIEDVCFYKSQHVGTRRFSERLDILHDTFTHNLRQLITMRKSPIFGLPAMHTSHEELVKMIHPQQRIGYFQYKHFNKHNTYRVKPHVVLKPQESLEGQTIAPTYHRERPPHMTTPNTPNTPNTTSSTSTTSKYNITKQPVMERRTKNAQHIERVFSVSATLQNDIYLLRDKENNDVGVAYIPDYVTSVMMNKIFRNIKENVNLDALEESDSEEEFEDMRPDKYVDLEKNMLMVCVFHYKFKKWVPTKLYERGGWDTR